MRVLAGIAVALVAGCEATRVSLLKKTLEGRALRKKQPLVTQVNAFATKEQACCACFKSKYAWPANAGLGAAFAPKQTCDTCYVTDIYGIPAKEKVVFSVAAPKLDAGKPPPPVCTNICDILPAPACSYTDIEAGTGKTTYVEAVGPGACDKLINDPLFQGRSGGNPCAFLEANGFLCPNSCGRGKDGSQCGSGAAYEQTDSKVMAVHEWNWNCASGNAPEDSQPWLTGPVEGEPESARGPFIMCKEDAGWYCPVEDGADLKMEAGADKPVEVDEGGSDQYSVGTMTLPVIDGATSVAASVSG